MQRGQVQQVSGEGSGEGLGGFGAEVRFNRVPEKVPENVWGALEHAEVFPGLGFAARFRKICKNKTLRLLGIPPNLLWVTNYPTDSELHLDLGWLRL